MAHTGRMRVGVLLLGALLTACGGGTTGDGRDTQSRDVASPTASDIESEPSVEKNPTVGAYRLTTRITKSNIPANKPGPKSKNQSLLFLTCADDQCSELYQRAASQGWHAGTVRLAATGRALTGSHSRSGPCTSGGGSYTEIFRWSWERSKDQLAGTVLQTFTGCGLDGSTTYDATAARDDGTALPYLEAEGSEAATAALNDYDETVRWVYDRFAACGGTGAGSAAQARCYAELYDRWAPSVEPLAGTLDSLAAGARGSCGEVLDELDFDGLAASLGMARKAYAAGPGRAADAAQQNESAVKIATRQHELIVSVALLCVRPDRYDTLGKDGALAVDTSSLVPPGKA